MFIHTIPPEEATGKLRELYDEDKQAHGRAIGATKVLSLRPDASAAWRALDRAVRSTMKPRHYELATIAAASRVRCTS
jgi:hypothetical protein